jgi:hypothetical protein
VFPSLFLDPAVDDLTLHEVFDCLRDITGANLPDDSNAWQTWYYEDARRRTLGPFFQAHIHLPAWRKHETDNPF